MKKHKWIFAKHTLSNLFVVCAGVLLYMALLNFSSLTAKISHFFAIIRPFIIGFAIAYLLNRPVNFFETRIFHKTRGKHGLSITFVYLLSFLFLGALIWLVIPQAAESVVSLVENVPTYIENITQMMLSIQTHFKFSAEMADPILGSYTQLVQQVTDSLTKIMPEIFNLSVALGNGFITAVTALISSIYMLLSKDVLLAQLRKLIYAFAPHKKATRVLEVCGHANWVFSGFIVGKLLDSFIIGIICFAGTTILQLPFALLISVIIGITNIIPFFGPFIGAIPCIMILLMADPLGALWFGIFIILLQQFDGNILGPKILGDSTGLSPIWVLVSIIVGGGLFGFAGMILGVPAFAVFYALSREFITFKLDEKGINSKGETLKNSVEVESETT